MVQEFQRRRNVIVDGLNKMGLRCLCPEGAFYVFPSVDGTGMTSKELAEFFLQKAGVAVLDGGCFGKYGNGCIYCIFCFTS
jgi:aminotransferase